MPTINKTNSPYSAAYTGCSFMLYELNRVLSLLRSKDSENLLIAEIEENKYLMIDNRKSRQRYMTELRRRYNSVTPSFWANFQQMREPAQRVALFYVLMKTYRLVFDLHINVTVKRFRSIDRNIQTDDLLMEVSQIAANDQFVDSWSDATKRRTVSAYLTFLNQAGLCDKKTGNLLVPKLTDEEFLFFVQIGEDWFLESCFLQPYEIERIKQLA